MKYFSNNLEAIMALHQWFMAQVMDPGDDAVAK